MILVSIDDIENARLKLLMDKVFGAENFLTNFVWKSKSGGASDSGNIAIDHEYILTYAKNAQAVKILPDGSATASTSYNRADEHGRYSLERLDKQNLTYSDAMDYDLIGPEGIVYHLNHKNPEKPNATWRWSRQRVQRDMDDLVFEGGNVYTKNYEKEGAKARSLLTEERFGRTRTGSRDLEALLGSGAFDNPKPIKLLKHLLSLASPPDGVVLDFFAGSGSTGHAVMDSNLADAGRRQYILVQLDELANNGGCSTIGEITRERLRRADKIIRTGPEKRRPRAGFRSYRLASSNIQPWDASVGQLDLIASVDNLVRGRSTHDLLVETMLRLGVELTTPVERREVAGSPLYNLGGTLYAYFGTDVTTERANEIARAVVGWRDQGPVDSDVTVVVRDTGFVDSSAKLNLAAALDQAGITTLRSI